MESFQCKLIVYRSPVQHVELKAHSYFLSLFKHYTSVIQEMLKDTTIQGQIRKEIGADQNYQHSVGQQRKGERDEV